jgi:dTDP-4-amino-4,6-dideoxygalactose transaminase
VITPPNSFVASTAAICHLGATPVFVDVLPDQNIDPNKIEAAITPRTKAIMPVHLTGRVAEMSPILEIAACHGLKVIEDAAQAIGSKYHGKMAGSLGDVGCFSLHPLKNLNAAGDGGFLTTNDAATAAMIRQRRSHGMIDRNTVACWGGVSRLDTLQAALVRYRLGRLADIIEKRRRNANLYRRLLPPIVYHPPCQPYEFNTFHTFVVQVPERDALQAYLTSAGIGSAIHYPVPIHLQPAAAQLGYKIGDFPVTETQAKHILSLPIHQYLHDDDIYHICDVIGQFFDQAVRAEVV